MNYYKTDQGIEEYIQAAKNVDSRKLIEKFRQHLPSHSKILEIGSGPGTDWVILNETFKVIGSDFSDGFLRYLKAHNPTGEFIKLDACDLRTDLTFDGLYSNKVLQHLTNEELEKSVFRQSNILKEGGIISHSFWNGEGEEDFKGMYINYQSTDSLNAIFSKHFEILSIEEYKEFDVADSISLIAKKKQIQESS